MKKINQWKVYTAVMSIFAIITTVGFCVNNSINNDKISGYENTIEQLYNKSYYDLMYSLSVVESNIAKLQISNSDNEQVKLLSKINKMSELAETNLIMFSHDNQFDTMSSYINRVSDYSQYLLDRVVSGNGISDAEVVALDKFYSDFQIMSKELYKINDEIGYGEYSFIKSMQDINSSLMTTFKTLQESSVELPVLTYDGAFSHSLEIRQPKELVGDVYSLEEAASKLPDYLIGYEIKAIQSQERIENHFNILKYDVELSDGSIAYIELTEIGAKLINLNIYRACAENWTIDEQKAKDIGQDYLQSIGIKDMEAVWTEDNNGTIYVNYARKIQDVIIYNELIKIKVEKEKGKIIGVECVNYILNHQEEKQVDISAITISEEEALCKVKDGVSVKSCRLALIPLPGDKEKLAYELFCTYKERLYYIYIDVETGKEADILFVVDGLLM